MSNYDSKPDSRCRKWLLTINNPIDKGWDHDHIKETLSKFKNCIYWCMSDETGEEGTFHTHVYFQCSEAAKFSTVKRRFPEAHIDMRSMSAQVCRDYVFKEGAQANTEKATTNHRESHEESGECPVERIAKSGLPELLDMVKSGMTTFEIINEFPGYINQLDKIDRLRQICIQDEHKNKRREVEVTYIWGPPGVGKTRFVMDTFGDDKVYRVTDYSHPFDSYNGEDIIAFEEFRTSIPIEDMLKYLDIYRVEAPARYFNRQLIFTKVFILTNIDLRAQYKYYQLNEPMTWKGFLRRINYVWTMTGQDTVKMDTEDYLQNYFPVFVDKTPFDKE